MFNKYEIRITEPFPNTWPASILVESMGIVKCLNIKNWQESYLLVKVNQPFKFNQDDNVEYLIISSRYEEFSMDDIQNKQCTIGIARFFSESNIRVDSQVKLEDIDYFAVGEIKPCR